MNIIIGTVGLMIFYISVNITLAYDNMDTHKRITEKGVHGSVVDNYLIQTLGLRDGLETKFPSNSERSILFLLKEASKIEDIPKCRATNHFHNPLKPWDQSAMSDDPWWLDLGCSSWRPWYSNVTWATGFLSPNGPRITPTNQWMGWKDARDYYYWALTAISKGDRETNFAKTFLALGQVAHLLQDVGVPAHVRNDFTSHYISYGPTINGLALNKFENYVKGRPELVGSAGLAKPSLINPRLTDFWDKDQYMGNNPSDSLTQGLAEFTNANYLSDWTIPNNNPTQGHSFPFPTVGAANTRLCEDLAPGSTDIRRYVSRGSGACPPITEARMADHFATPSLLNEESSITNENLSSLKLGLDENVHNTYAKELIPRAIGYSAALFDYFFRGRLQVTAIPLFYRNSLYMLKLTIINGTPNETIEQGEFALRYRYTPPGGPEDGSGDMFGQGWSLDGSATIPCVRLESGESVEVSFLFLDSIPVEILSSLKLTLAFQGTLGREEGAVIGKVFSPGEIKFNEEWNNDLHGNHTWFHTGVDGPNPYPEFAIVSNQTPNNLLTKDLTFLVVEGGRQDMLNSSFVGGTGQRQDIFPILVTPKTYLQFKIDDITLTRNPAPPGNFGPDHFQGVLLHFSGGLSLLFSPGGYDPIVDHSKSALYSFTPGNTIWVDKIYRLFQDAGITIPPGPFYLWDISFDQLLFYTYPDAEYHAHMVVDFIRIIEAAESESP